MAIEYQRDVEANHGGALEAEMEHVRDHVAGLADPNDDPAPRRADVRVWLARHPDDPSMMRIEGWLDAEPVAEYLADDFEPLAGVDPALFEQEAALAYLDEIYARGMDDGQA